jgi:hypothetical protein
LKNKEFTEIIEEILTPLVGYYSNHTRQRLAFFFDDAPETAQVKGLEVVVRPKTSGYQRVFSMKKSRTSIFFITLIQHEGDITIYDAEEKLREFFDSYPEVISYESREPNKADTTQQRKPILICRVEILEFSSGCVC